MFLELLIFVELVKMHNAKHVQYLILALHAILVFHFQVENVLNVILNVLEVALLMEKVNAILKPNVILQISITLYILLLTRQKQIPVLFAVQTVLIMHVLVKV